MWSNIFFTRLGLLFSSFCIEHFTDLSPLPASFSPISPVFRVSGLESTARSEIERKQRIERTIGKTRKSQKSQKSIRQYWNQVSNLGLKSGLIFLFSNKSEIFHLPPLSY
jgi:hypothetical protein